MGEWSRRYLEQEEELDVYLGRWMDGWVAGCQTRPIAEAHHKTHAYDVGNFAKTRGMSIARKEASGSARSTAITCQCHAEQASSMERSRTSVVAPGASRSPSPHVDARQRLAGSSRNDDAEPQSLLLACLFLQASPVLPYRLPFNGDGHVGTHDRRCIAAGARQEAVAVAVAVAATCSSSALTRRRYHKTTARPTATKTSMRHE